MQNRLKADLGSIAWALTLNEFTLSPCLVIDYELQLKISTCSCGNCVLESIFI